MADRFYSLAHGDQGPEAVTEGASTSSEAVELRINDSAYSLGSAVIDNMIETLQNYVRSKETNPIA